MKKTKKMIHTLDNAGSLPIENILQSHNNNAKDVPESNLPGQKTTAKDRMNSFYEKAIIYGGSWSFIILFGILLASFSIFAVVRYFYF
jgi:hypothetical protein